MSDIQYRDSDYGKKILAVEPGGVEAIAEKDRHGKVAGLFAVWASPNLEFATIFVGALGIFAFGLTFTQAVLGILIGNVLGALAQYSLTQDGPRYGVTQMVAGRAAFGKNGNAIPSLTNWFAAGIGWFAVNSVSGGFALAALTNWSDLTSLTVVVVVQIAVAFIGHNLVLKVEKYLMPYLVVVFAIAGIVALTKAHLSDHGSSFPGAFLIFTAAVYGYAAGWNPFASDYSRYLPANSNKKKAGLSAALGLFVSTFILESVGAAAVTHSIHAFASSSNPVSSFTTLLPTWLGKLILLGIVLGSICANALNIYSGSISLTAVGIKIGNAPTRALIILLTGVIGFIVAHWAMPNAATNLQNFLLVMSYWIGPWLGVIFADKLLRKGASTQKLLFANRENLVGPIAFVVSTALAIWLFANQTYYVGLVPKHVGAVGDLTFPVGFVLAFVIYAIGAKGKVASEQ